jgi:hypothetical protein
MGYNTEEIKAIFRYQGEHADSWKSCEKEEKYKEYLTTDFMAMPSAATKIIHAKARRRKEEKFATEIAEDTEKLRFNSHKKAQKKL